MPPAFEMLIQDARFGARMLRKRPAAALLAIATLALAVGVGTAVFSIVNAILIQPLPYREPDRLVMLWNVNEKAGFDLNQQRMMGRSLSVPEFADWQRQTGIFEHVMLFGSYLTRVGRNENPEMAMGYRAGPGLFSLLGINPMLGRGFLPEDDVVGAENVIVLLHHFWLRRFGGDPAVLGQKLYLGAQPYTIVGVGGPEFVFYNRMVDFVVPGQWNTSSSGQARASRFLRSMARLKPGLALAEAQARADAVSADFASRYAENKDWRVVLVPVLDESAGVIQPAMRALLVAVACVLLIGCINVTNLLLVEATVRAKELTVRTALGATRFQLTRLLLTQSMALAAIGGLAGFGLAHGIIRYFQSALPDRFSHMKFLLQLEAIRIDGSVIWFAAGMVLSAGLLSGLVPAWIASRTDPNRMLKDSGAGSVGGRQVRTLRHGLVIGQVAIAVLLVVGAVLLARSMAALYGRGPGFRPDNLLSMEVAIPWEHIQEEIRARSFASNQERLDYQRERFAQAARSYRARIAVELDRVPGVTGYTATNVVPLSSYYQLQTIVIEGRDAEAATNPPVALFNAGVSASFFKLLGLPLRSGRFFGTEDRADGQRVAIVSAEFVRRYFAGKDPLGQRIRIGGGRSDAPWMTIIGTVGDVNEDGLDRPPQPYVYQYDEQFDWNPRYLIVQSPLPPAAILPAVQRAIRNVEPHATIYRVVTLSDLARNSVWRVYYSTLLLGGLAALAFVMALIGVYGVLSYAVRERTQEIGVRIALGADRGKVIALVVGQGLGQVASGIGLGLLAALSLTHFLRTLLYGVGAMDLATYLGVAAGLLAAGALASYLPAQRAARLDPVKALRCE